MCAGIVLLEEHSSPTMDMPVDLFPEQILEVCGCYRLNVLKSYWFYMLQFFAWEVLLTWFIIGVEREIVHILNTAFHCLIIMLLLLYTIKI